MKKNLILVTLTLWCFSCQKKEARETVIPKADQNSVPAAEIPKQNKRIGDTIYMDYKNTEGIYTAESSLDSINSKIYLKIKNEEVSELSAKIVPDSAGNIRFNQVLFPDKTADGPFGMDLKMDLNQIGNYILMIGHSQMAENPYQGNFKVLIENKKK